jgi:hypothetical protein
MPVGTARAGALDHVGHRRGGDVDLVRRWPNMLRTAPPTTRLLARVVEHGERGASVPVVSQAFSGGSSLRRPRHERLFECAGT